MKTIVDMNDELLRRAEARAAEEGRSLDSLIEEGLVIILNTDRQKKPRRVEVPVLPGEGGVLPGIDLNNSAALQEILDREDFEHLIEPDDAAGR